MMKNVFVLRHACAACPLTGSVCTKIPEGSVRSREFLGLAIPTPLAVSASRGVGCVLVSGHRAVLFDLEEDEEDEAEEEDAEEDDDTA